MIRKLKSVFVVDFLGAVVSGSIMFFVIARLPEYFGLQPKIAVYLALLPCVFFVYSLASYLLVKSTKQMGIFLKGIIWGNSLYCLLTFGILLFFFPSSTNDGTLTILGAGYLSAEIVVIIGVVLYECRILRKIKQSHDE